jgi:hypothetical protein
MLSVLAILLVSVTIYDFALKAEYLSGNYKNPFAGYASKNIKDFNEIEVDAINMLHVTIQQGDYAVRVSKTNTDSIKLTQTGNRLIVNVDFAKRAASDDPNVMHGNDIVIYCPRLVYIKTDEHHYSIPRKKMTDEQRYEVERGGRSVNLNNFILDSLSIEQKTGSFNINGSKIGVLKSTTAARSRLHISDDTRIGQAEMHINDHSYLTFEKFNVPKFSYTLADSATIAFTSKGNFFKELMK